MSMDRCFCLSVQHPAEAHASEPLAPPARGAVWADCGPFKRLSFSGESGWKGKEAMGYNLALLPSEALCFLLKLSASLLPM